MMDIGCEVIKDLMPLYADDICSEKSKAIVAKHLEGCESCRREYELLTRKLPVELKAQDSSVIVKIAKKWKKDKKKSFLYGFIFLFVIVAAIVDFMIYSNFTVPVSNDDITVSNVCELENGKIFFTLEVSDLLYANDYTWTVKDHAVYITINAVRYNIFHKKNEKYEFGKNTFAKSNWLFNVNNTGIKEIYYCELNNQENKNNAFLIWSEDAIVNEANNAVNTYVQTYNCYGNLEPGLLAEQLFDAKNQYVGDMSANGRLAALLNIQYALGNYKNELQTKKEPYGWTLEFQDVIDESKEEKFNKTMTDYAYVLLALTNNLSEVTWKYQNNSEQKELKVTAKEASVAIGKNIKNFSESSISVQELLLKLGME